MNTTLSKALTGAAWFLVGVGALKKALQTSPQSTIKNAPPLGDKGASRKDTTDASRPPDSSPSH